MLRHAIDSIKEYVGAAPKSIIAFACVGISSLALAIILVTTHRNPGQPVQNVSATSQSSDATAQGNISGQQSVNTTAGAATSNKTSTTVNAGTSRQPQTSNSSTTAISSPVNKPSSGTKSASTPSTTPPSVPASPKADYNLNDGWYFASAGTAGIYNNCWPTPMTVANEASCGDPSNPYTGVLFTGVGIAKTPEAAQSAASAQALQKADAQHVDPRRGGGEDAMVLTEALCLQHGLSCGRW